MLDLPMRQYQQIGVDWLRHEGRGLLADEMGLGKSRVLIEASQGRTLVVAPAMVLSGGTWDDEIRNWADDPSRFTQIPYTSLHTRAEGAPKFRLIDRKRVYTGEVREGYGIHWDTIILDEAHYIKGRATSWTKAVLNLTGRAGQVFTATGTPIPNFAQEMFTLLQAIDPQDAAPGARLGSYWRWVQTWFDTYPDRYSQYNVGGLRQCTSECADRPPYDPCQHYYEFTRANLGSRFLQRRRDDVLPDLPPLTEQTVLTPMGPDQKRAYQRMKKEFMAIVDDKVVMAWSASAQHVKLDRITTGLDLLEPGAAPKVWAKKDNPKLLRLESDLQGRSSPTVVMAHYRDTVEACADVARSVGARVATVHGGTSNPNRLRAVRGFQSGEFDVLVGSLETLAEGLTLTAADLLIFVEMSYKPSRNQQAMRRIHRLGQTRPCLILNYLTPDTVDEHKRELLKVKTDHQMRVLTAAQFKELL